MGSYGSVNVGGYTVTRIREGLTTHLVALLRDEAIVVSPPEEEGIGEIVFHMPGTHLADRLDVIGINRATVAEAFAEVITERRSWPDPEGRRRQEEEHLDGLNADVWIERVRREAQTDRRNVDYFDPPGSIGWLMDLLDGFDDRYALRLALLALPDEQVTVTLTDRGEGWLEGDTAAYASEALQAMQAWGSTYSPTVVLTEGKTDAEFLGTALSVLYPHLTDLVRLMNFDFRPEGSAAALVKSIKSFAAAGISNRIVALFDNDSAAADALRSLDIASLPHNFHVCRYPTIELARDYPTLGPPSVDSPSGVLSAADVNQLAGSIELYLGRDVLTDDDGKLRPV